MNLQLNYCCNTVTEYIGQNCGYEHWDVTSLVVLSESCTRPGISRYKVQGKPKGISVEIQNCKQSVKQWKTSPFSRQKTNLLIWKDSADDVGHTEKTRSTYSLQSQMFLMASHLLSVSWPLNMWFGAPFAVKWTSLGHPEDSVRLYLEPCFTWIWLYI